MACMCICARVRVCVCACVNVYTSMCTCVSEHTIFTVRFMTARRQRRRIERTTDNQASKHLSLCLRIYASVHAHTCMHMTEFTHKHEPHIFSCFMYDCACALIHACPWMHIGWRSYVHERASISCARRNACALVHEWMVCIHG